MPAPDQLRLNSCFSDRCFIQAHARGVFEGCTKIPLKERVLRLLKSQTFSRRVWLPPVCRGQFSLASYALSLLRESLQPPTHHARTNAAFLACSKRPAILHINLAKLIRTTRRTFQREISPALRGSRGSKGVNLYSPTLNCQAE